MSDESVDSTSITWDVYTDEWLPAKKKEEEAKKKRVLFI